MSKIHYNLDFKISVMSCEQPTALKFGYLQKNLGEPDFIIFICLLYFGLGERQTPEPQHHPRTPLTERLGSNSCRIDLHEFNGEWWVTHNFSVNFEPKIKTSLLFERYCNTILNATC